MALRSLLPVFILLVLGWSTLSVAAFQEKSTNSAGVTVQNNNLGIDWKSCGMCVCVFSFQPSLFPPNSPILKQV